MGYEKDKEHKDKGKKTKQKEKVRNLRRLTGHSTDVYEDHFLGLVRRHMLQGQENRASRPIFSG